MRELTLDRLWLSTSFVWIFFLLLFLSLSIQMALVVVGEVVIGTPKQTTMFGCKSSKQKAEYVILMSTIS